MYYCSNCGVILFLSRPENKEKPKKPSVEKDCNYCNLTTRFRKILPEDLGAPNSSEVEKRLTALEGAQ